MAHEMVKVTADHSSEWEVEGEYLRAKGPLVLPTHRCVKCGSSERGGTIHTDVLNYVNPFIWLTLLISGLITIIAYLATRKQMEVQYYLCPKCADSRRIGRLTTNAISLVSIGGLIATMAGGPFEIFAAALIISLLARAFWVRAPLHAVVHDRGLFSLKGASPRFLASLERRRLEHQ